MSEENGLDFLDLPLPAKLAIALIPTAAAVWYALRWTQSL